MGAATQILSAVAANRKQFFDLVSELEKHAACDIDELELQAEIDSACAGRASLTEGEAQSVLMKVARPKGHRRQAAGG